MKLELLTARDGERVRLSSPDVGWFTEARGTGSMLASGERAGVLIALGRSIELVVPEEVSGVVTSPMPERVHWPVGYGDVLYELAPIEASGARSADRAGIDRRSVRDSSSESQGSKRDDALVLRSPQSGRFYQRPAPGEPQFVVAGGEIAEGTPVGLIEVMKTFTHVVYRASSSLPPRARLKRFIAGDGADVRQGDVLIEIEAI
jgi:biotin carboxyl carrier protein